MSTGRSRAFCHDLLHGVLHFEGKIWRTLPMLAWRPGELTRRYIDGERARFVSPIALFLFCVFLMFAVASLTGGSTEDRPTKQMKADVAEQIKEREATLRQQRGGSVASAEGGPIDGRDRRRNCADAARVERACKQLREKARSNGSAVQVSDDLPDWLA